MTTRICFIRHGETDWNVEHRIQGQTDIPLNDTGRQQALAMAFSTGKHVFSALYSSDLQRALETARAVAQHREIPLIPLPELRERHFGIMQGLTSDEASVKLPETYALYKARDLEINFENGESMHQFVDRVTRAVQIMVSQHSGQTLCAVTHAGVLDILYRKTTGRPLHTPRDFDVPNCALNWFRFDAQGWHLEAWDDHHHVPAGIRDAAE